jgi:hypothetical protein
VPHSAPPGEHAPLGAAAARAAFVRWLRDGGEAGRRFLEVWLRPAATGRYDLLHAADCGLPRSSLDPYGDPVAAQWIARSTAEGAHRPLKSSPNLRRGWILGGLDELAVCRAMDYLYPACIAHWHAGITGTLRVTDWAETAARQSGMYSAVGLLPTLAVNDLVRACCDEAVCLRAVAWGIEGSDRPPRSRDPGGGAEVPCPQACSLFISLARKALELEREPRSDVPPVGALNRTELHQLVDVARGVAAGTTASVREGDFENAANLRRVRYLVARLDRQEQQSKVKSDG